MQVIKRHFDHPRKGLAFNLLAALFGLALVIVLVSAFQPGKAKAADKGKPAADPVAQWTAPSKGWNGCGVSASGGLANADADLSPITIGANGQTLSAGAYCDRAFDRFVLGLFADHSWVFGDLDTVGVERVYTGGGRAGVLITQSVLAYALVAAKRAEFTGGHANGIAFGVGMEAKLPGAPFFLALEAQKSTYSNVMGSTVDINADEVWLRLRYKFAFGGN